MAKLFSFLLKVGESIRRNAPNEMQCSMFCGGRRCKYEQGSASSWKKEDMAIDGIYSHWITDDILAMARPNTAAMKKDKLVEQFKVTFHFPGIILIVQNGIVLFCHVNEADFFIF